MVTRCSYSGEYVLVILGKLTIKDRLNKSYISCHLTSSSIALHSHFNQFKGIRILSGVGSQMQLEGMMAN